MMKFFGTVCEKICGHKGGENGKENSGARRNGAAEFAVILLSAVLYSLSFLCQQLWFVPWIATVPLSHKLLKSQRRAFGSLFCFFFVFYVGTYSWLVSMYPLDFAGLGNFESILVIIAGLVLIPLIHSVEMSFSVWLFYKLSQKTEKRGVLRCAFIAMGYVFGEFLQGVGDLGFPWARMYVSQVGRIENLQSAKIFGSYFISFIIVFVNLLIGLALVDRKKAKAYVATAFALIALNYAFGCGCIFFTEKSYRDDETITAVALQGNISSYSKWSSLENSYNSYKTLAKKASKHCEERNLKADIAVLPETAFPETALAVADGKERPVKSGAIDTAKIIAEELSCPTATGFFAYDDGKEYNAVAVIDENGKILGKYYKKHLVPFGEFVPYRKVLENVMPFLTEINMLSDDLASGKIGEPIDCGRFKAVSLVCFDSVFARDCALQTGKGADVILVSTNDSWYKTSRALNQHLAHSVMRAIENHRPLIRSANTGISAAVEPTGKITTKSNVNEAEFFVSTLHTKKNETPYTRVGDLTLYMCFACLLILAMINMKKEQLCRNGFTA